MTCAETCSEIGAVRLVGGAIMAAGRLEICANGHWGSVCNDGFDANAAAVVCRQLGFQEDCKFYCRCIDCVYKYKSSYEAVPEVKSGIFFGGGGTFQPIHLDDLRCSGAEATLLNCTHTGVGMHDCEHPEDVGIICQRSQGRLH